MKRILNLILFAAISLTAAAQPAYTHPWQGKRIAYFGDSITDPREGRDKEMVDHA